MPMQGKVFARAASGLVKEMSLYQAAWWGIAGSGGFYLLFYFLPYGPYYLPGADIPLAIVACIIVMLPFYALYAAFGSAMPRAGGDYVYQSRVLHPSVGFAFPMGWFTVLWIATFVAFGGYVIASLGLGPVFMLLGYASNNATFISWGNWYQGTDGMYAVSIATGLLSLLITITGMRWWVRSQKYILAPFTVITNIVLLYLLAGASPQSFHAAFNSWGQLITGNADLYGTVLKAAAKGGYVTPVFSLRNTMILMSVISIYIAWTMWSSQGILGEVKNAQNLGKLFVAYLGSGLYLQWIVLWLPMVLFVNVAGWDFIHAISFAYYNGLGGVTFFPTVSLLASMLTTNPVLIVLVSLGFIAGGFFIAASEFVIVTRIWISMALDRVLPEWFGSVNEKTHTPVKTTVLSVILSLITATAFYYWPPFYPVIIVGAVVGPTAVVSVTSIAGILFAKRLPRIYETAPIAKYKVGRIPLMPIIGVISFIVSFSIVVIYLTTPELGYNQPVPIAYTFGILFACAAWFYMYRAIQRRRGIIVDLAYKEITPE